MTRVVLLAIAAAALDVGTFALAAQRVDVVAAESNPIALGLWLSSGLVGLIVLKWAAIATVVSLAPLLDRDRQRVAYLVVASVWAIGAASNVRGLL